MIKPADVNKKITEVEALKFHSKDLEIRNLLQEKKLTEMEIILEEKKHKEELQKMMIIYKQKVESLELKKQQLAEKVNAKRQLYIEFVDVLAKTYEVDPKFMVIDTETCVIREVKVKGQEDKA